VSAAAGGRPGGRVLKRRTAELLRTGDFPAAMEALGRYPARRVVSPLFGLLCDAVPLTRWRAVAAMGRVVARLAEQDLESARVVVRRCIWNLNEESGGIGWGCPEAMAEILSNSARLAEEFGRVFTSYLRPGGNYLEYPAIQPGVIWGFGRLAAAYPGRMDECADLLLPFLGAEDAWRRGLAAWAAGGLGRALLLAPLERLAADGAAFEVWEDARLKPLTVGAAACESRRKVQALLDKGS
jgi:hypothetical protein